MYDYNSIKHYDNKFFKHKKILNRSITYLTRENNNIIKRYTGTKVHIIEKTLNSNILDLKNKTLLNKIIFLRYCDHFKTLNLTQLLNDKLFINMVNNSLHNSPSLHSRAFQLAIEVTYSKRKFSEDALQKVYENDFIIKDCFNVNKGFCDQSTIYTSSLVKKITDYFNYDKSDVVVNSTPLYFIENRDITVMEYNKHLTGNTVPDVVIKERPFDIKDKETLSYGKNQVFFVESSVLEMQGSKIFYNIIETLENSLKDKQNILSQDTRIFTKNLLKFLQEQKSLQITYQNRIDNLNKFIDKSTIPKDFKCIMIIPKKNLLYEEIASNYSEKQIDNVLLDSGPLNQVKAKKAIMGILNPLSKSQHDNIEKITNNSIQFSMENDVVD